ncbi:DUF2029 domain-containing protein [Mycolicibacterium sp. P1-18]|uniref:glycosyltransferase 87 family protein n=1 Tax=Mycolicibacterium sp. P1-18 TaxID=2024615 RepID=UPI0011F162B7|nr:glycosyltransferase 87 family protein [Mycolicibacterium sp. P1-18]KAA0096058.1 DUF2029 domain-containing protein [Mycolicibacterium sp. P1-18]
MINYPDDRRTVSWTAIAVAGLAAVVAVGVHQALVPFLADPRMGLFTNGGDLEVYRHGALQVLHGQPLYAAKLPPGGWFTYPPFAAMSFLPLALLNSAAAKALWMLVSFTGLVATIWRCATTLGWRPELRLLLLSVALALVALDVQAVRGTLWQGQVNLILMAIVTWDLTRANDSRLRGWSVGVAAGVKLTAVVFIPYLLVTRQWRAAAVATGTAALTVALGWLILPSDSTAYWLHAAFQTDRIGPLAHVGNYSVGGIVATVASPGQMPIAWWLAGVVLISVLALIAAQRAERGGERLLAVTIAGLLSCAVPPLAWGHHWVWSVPLLAWALDRTARARGRERVAWAVGVGATYLLVFMWFTAWVFRKAEELQAHSPNHAAAMGAAVGEMSRLDQVVVVATHPALLVAVASAIIWFAKRPNHSVGADPFADRVRRASG